MTKLSKTPTLFLLWFIVLPHQIVSAFDAHGGGRGQYTSLEEEEKPSIGKKLIDTIYLLRKSHKSCWEKVKTIIYEMQLQVFRPSLDFRDRNEEDAEAELAAEDRGTREKMKDAVMRSIGESKNAVEESAKSAAEALEEAAHIKAGKVMETVSDNEETHDEL